MKSTIIEKQKQLEDLKEEIVSDDNPNLESNRNIQKTDSQGAKIKVGFTKPGERKPTEGDEENNQTISLSGYHQLGKDGDKDNGKLKSNNELLKSQLSLKERDNTNGQLSTPKNTKGGLGNKLGTLGGTNKNLNQEKSRSDTIVKPGSSIDKSNNLLPDILKGGKFSVDSKNTLDHSGRGSPKGPKQPTTSIRNLDFLSKGNLQKLDEKIQKNRYLRGNLTDRLKYRRGVSTADDQNFDRLGENSHVKNLFRLRKQLMKNYSKELSGPKKIRVIDATGRVIEKLTHDELSKRTVHLTEESEREDLSADETIVYEEQIETGVLLKRKIKRHLINDVFTKEMLEDIDRQIQEASSRFQYQLEDLHTFVPNNLFDNLNSQTSRKSKTHLKSKSNLSDLKSVIFSRTNNNLPVAFKNIAEIKLKVQLFILIWLRDNVDLDAKTVEILLRDPHSRDIFFKENEDLFQLVLDTILKRPNLYSKIREFVFDKHLDDQGHIFTHQLEDPKLVVEEKSRGQQSVSTNFTIKTSRGKKESIPVPWKGDIVASQPDSSLLKTTVIAPPAVAKPTKGKSILLKSKKAYYDQLRATTQNYTR